ncbi:MAG TPA: DNA/RNA non-specific endonuclease [Myxococcaceae bacterium]|nr:DNA/RNA non-specific endonuclease [Myxococcaceae bacterium]
MLPFPFRVPRVKALVWCAAALTLWSGCNCGGGPDIDDHNACTVDSMEQSTGTIRHAAVDIDDGNPCTVDSCDPATGVHHDPVAVEDGDACTVDWCDPVTGIHHGPAVVDDQNACTVDSCDPATGVHHVAIAFDDGDACTVDSCDPATGVHHAPAVVDDQDACTTDSCDVQTGVHHVAVGIDDGNACTVDSCDAVTGVHHAPAVVDDQDACTTDSCDVQTGVHHVPVAIDDGNACTTDSCNAATGVHHDPVPIDDGNACTADSCDVATGVRHDAIPIDDGNACTADSCDVATGVHHDPVLVNDGNACTADSCDPATGVHHDAIPIDDQNACTADSCDVATGVHHDPVPIDDQNACTADSCDVATGVHHDVIPIDDGNACTADSCDVATGVHHDPTPTDDQNACTADACDPSNGNVTHTPVAIDDQNACTTDSCDVVTGVHHDPVPTDDQNACTTDSCDPTSGAVSHTPVATNDNNACTVDSCDPVTGVHHDPVAVDDNNACTTDSCNPASGAISHTPVNVNDGIACTTDSCDPATGLHHDPVDSLCETDGLSCTAPHCSAATGCSELPDNSVCGDPNGCPAARCVGASGAPGTGCSTSLVDVNCGPLQVCRSTGCAPAAPTDQVGNVVVSEFSALGPELVEISNPGATSMNIRGFVLGNVARQVADIRATSDLDAGRGIAVTIPPGGRLFGVPNPPGGSAVPDAGFVYGAQGTAFAMADTGDVLSIYSGGGNTLQDYVDFRNLASGARVPVGPTQFVAAPGLTTQVVPGAIDSIANDSPGAWCTTFYPQGTTHRAYNTAGAANTVCTGAVISEISARSPQGDDGRTWVEIAGPGGALVGGMKLEDVVANGPDGGNRFVDGDFGPGEIDGEYVIPAGTRLPPGGFLVIADGVNSGAQGTSGSLVPGLVPGVDLIARDMDLQDGPASLQLISSSGALLDAVAHHNPIGTRVDAGTARFNGFPLYETTPAVSPMPHTSLARTSAEDDRGDNRLDFVPSVPTPGSENVPIHLWLGRPDNSSIMVVSSSRYLFEKRQYTLSYNGSLKNPNWSAWELNSLYDGVGVRQDDYRSDPNLPASIPQALIPDYQSSGWDRGHMCPSADRLLDNTENSATFWLTNMVPQASNNNQGPWADLENYTRCLVDQQGKELFIISGGLYEGAPRFTKAGSTVRVPNATWKVITVLNAPGQGPADVNTSTRVISVLMPNDDMQIGLNDDWRKYAADGGVTARAIEQRTGLNFMSAVPQPIQDVIETRLDPSPPTCNGF